MNELEAGLTTEKIFSIYCIKKAKKANRSKKFLVT